MLFTIIKHIYPTTHNPPGTLANYYCPPVNTVASILLINLIRNA